jgi:hypothetical protein
MSDTQEAGVPPENPSRPVPPVRTRWIDNRPIVTKQGMLPPTRSTAAHVRRSASRPTDAGIRDTTVDAQAGEASVEWEPPKAVEHGQVPWEDPESLQTTGAETDTWAVLEFIERVEEYTVELEMDAEGDADLELDESGLDELELVDLELVDLDVEDVALETRSLEPLPEGAVTVQAPLSAWDITDTYAGEESSEYSAKAARAREEWESLGAALAASIGGEDASVFESAMQALAEGIAAAQTGDEGSDVTREIVDIADRMAWFAARLRSEGYHAITSAQAGADRLDIALAGLAAAFLAGHME